MSKSKAEIVTFKVDELLLAAMRGIPNRSEFIRAAVLAALDGACPLCKGAGTLSSAQRKHWEAFSQDHALQECDDCHEVHLVCSSTVRRKLRRKSSCRKKGAD